MRHPLCSIAFLVLVPAAASATDWFVNAATGSNANSGTSPSSSFLSLAWAVSVAGPGDRIFVAPGLYAPSTTGEVYTISVGLSAPQQNLQLLGAGAAVTILDGEGSPATDGLVRFYSLAQGARFSGFTVRNHAWYFGAIRLGSASTTPTLLVHDVEIDHCVFEDNSPGPGVATFGACSGLRIHDNLFRANGWALPAGDIGNIWLSDVIAGTGGGDVYHNTFVDSPNVGVRVQGGVWNFYNNVVATNAHYGVWSFDNPPAPTTQILNHDFNDVWGNAGGEWQGFTPNSNDRSVDPVFVNAAGGDFHLQATSPLLDAGTSAVPGFVASDGDFDPRFLDADANGTATPDIGYDEWTNAGLALAGTFGLGQVVTYALSGPAGDLGVLTFSLGPANLLIQPFGNLLLDVLPPNGLPLFFVAPVPLLVQIGIPNDPTLSPLILYSQGASVTVGAGVGKFTRVRRDIL